VSGGEIGDAVRSLVERGTFAVLAVLTREGDVVLRPIGGRWGAGIVDAIREMAERYPGCRMRLFEHPYDDWDLYFKHVVGRAQKDMYEKLGELYEKAGKGEGVKVFVKGKMIAFDVQPIIVRDRTMVPVRAIAEALGAQIKWDGETQTVTVLKAGKVVLIPIGSARALVDGAEVALDVPR